MTMTSQKIRWRFGTVGRVRMGGRWGDGAWVGFRPRWRLNAHNDAPPRRSAAKSAAAGAACRAAGEGAPRTEGFGAGLKKISEGRMHRRNGRALAFFEECAKNSGRRRLLAGSDAARSSSTSEAAAQPIPSINQSIEPSPHRFLTPDLFLPFAADLKTLRFQSKQAFWPIGAQQRPPQRKHAASTSRSRAHTVVQRASRYVCLS